MEYEFKVAEGNLMYVKKNIVELLGEEMKGIVGYKALLLYPKDADLETVKRSLEIIRLEIENRIADERKGAE